MEMVLSCLGGWFCIMIIIIICIICIIVLCVGTHSVTRVEVRGCLVRISSFQPVDSGNQTQVGRMGGKCFSPLSRLARHGGCFGYGVLFGVQVRASVAKRIWREGFST